MTAKAIASVLYNVLVVPVFYLLVRAAGLVNSKVRRGIKGRAGLFERLEQDVQKLTASRRVWFHASSMGEFEQARPIIAALRKKYSTINIIVTFFSPSGYDHSKNYKLADLICYLPFDSRAQASRFLDLIRPTAAVMVRYDIWPNHIWELERRGIPVFIANATMRMNSRRHWPVIRTFHHELYQSLTSILTVSERDVTAFRRFRLTRPHLEAVGETRYDQVFQRSEEAKTKHILPESITRRKRVLVVGSSWPEDEEVVLPTFTKIIRYDAGVLMILVPHEPTEEALEQIETALNGKVKHIRFSDLNEYGGEPVIIVDSIGILMTLYQYADVAYVGGSFRQNVHNVLEPAVYGIPVVYGPVHENSQEAVELRKRGAGFVVHDQHDCYRTLRLLLGDKKERAAAGAEAQALVKENVGATERFLHHLEKVL